MEAVIKCLICWFQKSPEHLVIYQLCYVKYIHVNSNRCLIGVSEELMVEDDGWLGLAAGFPKWNSESSKPALFPLLMMCIHSLMTLCHSGTWKLLHLLRSPAETNLEPNFLLNFQFEYNLSIPMSVLRIKNGRYEQIYIFLIWHIKPNDDPSLFIWIVGTKLGCKDYFRLICANCNGKIHNVILHMSSGVSKKVLPIHELIDHSNS